MERVIEISALDDIILTIQKQSKPIKHTQQEIQQIKEKYILLFPLNFLIP